MWICAKTAAAESRPKRGERRFGGPRAGIFAIAICIPAAVSIAPAAAQQEDAVHQTIGRFNAENAENRDYTDIQNRLRLQELRQKTDRRNGALGCQGIGGATGADACRNNLQIQSRQRALSLDRQILRQRQIHRNNLTQPNTLNGISVRPRP